VEQRGRLSIEIALAGLLAGVLGDLLLRAFPWGINLSLWVGLLVLITVGLARRFKTAMSGDGRFLALPIGLFAALFAWRDSLALAALNLLALLALIGLAVVYSTSGRLRLGGVWSYLLGWIQAGLALITSPFELLFSAIPWRGLTPGRWGKTGAAVVRGLLIAVPLLLVFGGLFAAADAVFAATINNLFSWDIEWLFEHIVVIGFLTWVVAGLLFQLFDKLPWTLPQTPRQAKARLGLIEIGIVLGVLNLLFAAFVLIQIRYLFGGETQLNLASGLTYAEYARKGFFELVTVVALALPTLLLAHWLLNPESGRSLRVFQGLAAGLIVLLSVVMVSALQRMRLYQQEYGLTELRLYTTAFMGWLALVFVWFGATVLRNRRQPFVSGAFGLGMGVLLLLNALNPDALIVNTNAGRATIRPFDSGYATSLSADAVPALVGALPIMRQDERCSTAARLLSDWGEPGAVDWRTWNWSRSQAQATVAANHAYLRDIACDESR
jgi:hypothetical protein